MFKKMFGDKKEKEKEKEMKEKKEERREEKREERREEKREKEKKLSRSSTLATPEHASDEIKKSKSKSSGNGSSSKSSKGSSAKAAKPKAAKQKRKGSLKRKKVKLEVQVDMSKPIDYPCVPEIILEYHKHKPFLKPNEEWLVVELAEFECLVDNLEIVQIIAKHSKFFELDPPELWEEFFEFAEDVPSYDEVINYDVWQEFRDVRYPC